MINLNNGGVHPAPRVVMEAVEKDMNFANGAPVYNSWNLVRPRKELIRQKLAETFGCAHEEIALVRNVTEALQIALLGIELKPGDEVLTTTHDNPSIKNALFQREKREGIVAKTFSFPSAEVGGEDVVSTRVAPSIYTSLEEVDMFVEAVESYVRHGLPE